MPHVGTVRSTALSSCVKFIGSFKRRKSTQISGFNSNRQPLLSKLMLDLLGLPQPMRLRPEKILKSSCLTSVSRRWLQTWHRLLQRRILAVCICSNKARTTSSSYFLRFSNATLPPSVTSLMRCSHTSRAAVRRSLTIMKLLKILMISPRSFSSSRLTLITWSLTLLRTTCSFRRQEIRHLRCSWTSRIWLLATLPNIRTRT